MAGNVNQFITKISAVVDVGHAKQPHIFEATLNRDSDSILRVR